MSGRRTYKNDESFLEKMSIGTIGTKKAKLLKDFAGFSNVELAFKRLVSHKSRHCSRGSSEYFVIR